MTEQTARTVANVIVASAGAVAAYMIVTTPPVRRAVFTGLRWWLRASLPLYLLAETRRAWVESARTG
jgi:hypothetical protein